MDWGLGLGIGSMIGSLVDWEWELGIWLSASVLQLVLQLGGHMWLELNLLATWLLFKDPLATPMLPCPICFLLNHASRSRALTVTRSLEIPGREPRRPTADHAADGPDAPRSPMIDDHALSS